MMNSSENEDCDGVVTYEHNHNPIADNHQLLPLNTAVIRRIRLNITTALSSNEVNANQMNDNHLIGSILQNTMKTKLANVLQSHSIHNNSDNNSDNNHITTDCDRNTKCFNVSDSPSMLDIKNKWSTIDQLYEQLNKTKSLNKMRSKVISLNSHLWNDFSNKMMEMRLLLNDCDQTQTQIAKTRKRTALKQKFIKQKKVKI